MQPPIVGNHLSRQHVTGSWRPPHTHDCVTGRTITASAKRWRYAIRRQEYWREQSHIRVREVSCHDLTVSFDGDVIVPISISLDKGQAGKIGSFLRSILHRKSTTVSEDSGVSQLARQHLRNGSHRTCAGGPSAYVPTLHTVVVQDSHITRRCASARFREQQRCAGG